MFSGIVQQLGSVRAVEDGRLIVEGDGLAHARVGDSIAVNGCCLTIAALRDGAFTADVMPETLRRTTLGALGIGDAVNLESALRFGEVVGGHLVSGHVDATGEIVGLDDEGIARRAVIAAPGSLLPLIAPQGSIAVDGISLTVVETDAASNTFVVALIPHTLAATTAGSWRRGSRVNLEVDVLARYVSQAIDAAVSHRAPAAALNGE